MYGPITITTNAEIYSDRLRGDGRSCYQFVQNLNQYCTAQVLKNFRDSSIGIATHYGLDGAGIESRWVHDFPHPSRPALGAPQPPSYTTGTASFLGVKRPGRGVDHPPHLAALWAFVACSRVNFTFTVT